MGRPGILDKKLNPKAVAAALGVVGACATSVLGFTRWKDVVPLLLAAAAVPFVARALSEPRNTKSSAETADDRAGLAGASRRRLFWALVVVVACTEIMVIRKPDAFVYPQFWQEDAFLFQDARHDGAASIFETLDRAIVRKGQTLFLLRVIAYVGRGVPARQAPLYYGLVALAVTIAVAGYVVYARLDGLGLLPKVLLALAIVFAFNTEQVYMTVINLQWILALLLLVMLMEKDPQTRAGRVALLILFIATCLTGPFITFLWPLFLLRALIRRTPWSMALFAASLPCAVWQLFRIQILFTSGSFRLTDPHWQTFLGRTYVGELLFGQALDGMTIPRAWYVALFLAVYIVLGIYAWRLRDGNIAMLLLASLFFLASAAVTYRIVPEAVAQPGHRYYFVPYVCLTWAFVIATARSWGRAWCLPSAAAVVAVALATASHYAIRPLADMSWDECSRAIEGPVPCIIYTNPFPQFFTYYEPVPLPKNYQVRTLPDPLPPRWH